MADQYAYRASEQFATAIRECQEKIQRFRREVVRPWDEAHPSTRSLWRRSLGLDQVFAGFSDPGGDIPEGLSRNQQRVELIPKRGWSGDPWRYAAKIFDQSPRVSPVFTAHNVDPWVFDPPRLHVVGIADTPSGVFLTWGAPHPSPGEYLTPVPLSEYYAAIEQMDETNPREIEAQFDASTNG